MTSRADDRLMELRQIRPSHREPQPEPMLAPLLVTADEAALLLGLGRTTFFAIVRDGLIAPVRIKGCVRYEVADLHRLIAEHRDTDVLDGVLDRAS